MSLCVLGFVTYLGLGHALPSNSVLFLEGEITACWDVTSFFPYLDGALSFQTNLLYDPLLELFNLVLSFILKHLKKAT